MMVKLFDGLMANVTAKFIWLVQKIVSIFILLIPRGIAPTLSVGSKLNTFFLKEHCSAPVCFTVPRLRPFMNLLVAPNLQTVAALKRFSKKYKLTTIVLSIFFFLLPFLTFAHEIRPAYLEIKQTTETTYDVRWKIPLLGNKAPKIDPILPCLLYTSPSPRDQRGSRMPSSA